MNLEKSVLFISDLDLWSLGQGTGGPALSRTVLAYRDAGWKVCFVTSNSIESNQEIEGIEIIRFDFKLIRFFFKYKKIGFVARLFFGLLFPIRVYLLARKANKTFRFSLIYGYEVFAMPSARILATLWKLPLIARFQGTSYNVGWGKRFRFIRAWDHWIGLRMPADLIIMTNDGTQGDKVLEYVGADLNKMRFWRNGVDKQDFLSFKGFDNPFRKDGNFQLLTVSRLVGWKRVDWSIRALSIVHKTIPNVSLTIIGDGEERESLEKLVYDLNLSEHVIFYGAVPHTEVKNHIFHADIFLSLYDWSNVGNPLLEAMLLGATIITLDNGDTGKIIQDNVNGILLNHDDFNSVPPSIIELLENTEKRDLLSLGARNTAKELFWEWSERLNAEIFESNSLVSRWQSKK
jgi:glycosyltransferase involved in cell wall biosynthesis